MSTRTTDENVSAYNPRPKYILAARDATGCEHVYRTADETVHIIHDGRRRQVVDLAANRLSIEDYITQVAAQRDIERVDLERTVVDALGQLEAL